MEPLSKILFFSCLCQPSAGAIPATRKLADVIKEVGPIYKDDKSADEAQRILRDLRALDLRSLNDTRLY